MIYSKKTKNVSQLILELSENQDSVTIAEIIEALKNRGIALLMAIFAVPAAMPAPAPILGTVLGLPLFFLVIQLFLGRKEVWLPQKINNSSISSANLKLASKWLKKPELLLHPRLGFVISRFVISIFCFIFVIVMMLPVPLTNTIPAFAILLISLGMFERDGLFVLAGIIIGSLWIAILTYAILIAGDQFVEFVRNML